ncbi:hypothetical protein [Ferruginibacter albus]|uniref:hypothetical protein n=1 Tax=Ferruginibacter albus TaxID=2875540 RepID=UPI001CC40CDF|nr:hypothetical protein [Ferruginibacter albus]UAY52889.1 hypothetical protein K9M53_04220 [Ferruginibacter albus]
MLSSPRSPPYLFTRNVAANGRKLSDIPETLPTTAGNFRILPQACRPWQEHFGCFRNLATNGNKLSGTPATLPTTAEDFRENNYNQS